MARVKETERALNKSHHSFIGKSALSKFIGRNAVRGASGEVCNLTFEFTASIWLSEGDRSYSSKLSSRTELKAHPLLENSIFCYDWVGYQVDELNKSANFTLGGISPFTHLLLEHPSNLTFFPAISKFARISSHFGTIYTDCYYFFGLVQKGNVVPSLARLTAGLPSLIRLILLRGEY